ncbi:hypothetical protein [Paraburkholderia heleia]|uniref:hypothetical protein n=1 Tax=Paraburkholderia heleia TaxID=634127 RepID=UPI000A763845|nr:hypothetical protein [Paraburkholderia heleia]
MSAAVIGLSCDAAIVRGADERSRGTQEPDGIKIALSGRPALPRARRDSGLVALRHSA